MEMSKRIDETLFGILKQRDNKHPKFDFDPSSLCRKMDVLTRTDPHLTQEDKEMLMRRVHLFRGIILSLLEEPIRELTY